MSRLIPLPQSFEQGITSNQFPVKPLSIFLLLQALKFQFDFIISQTASVIIKMKCPRSTLKFKIYFIMSEKFKNIIPS